MTEKPSEIKYKRILLKLSGEALMGEAENGIDPLILNRIADEINDLKNVGVEVAIVVGAGNAASHRAFSPTEGNLKDVLEIVEHFLKGLCVLPTTSRRVESDIPRRDN